MRHNKRVQPVVDYAQKLGFTVHSSRRRQHLKFLRPGCQPVFSSATPSDNRAAKNAMSQLRRSAANVALH